MELKYQNQVISIFFLNQIDLRKTIFVFFQQNPPSQGRKGADCSHCMEPITNCHVSHSLYGNFTRYRTKLVVIEMYLYSCPYFGIRFILVTPVSIQHKLITDWGKRASKRTKNVGTVYHSIWLLSLVLDLRPFRHCSFMGHEENSVKVFQLIVNDNTQ